MSAALLFDEPSHTYSVDGRPVANISRLIAHVDPYPKHLWKLIEAKRPIGQAAHKAAELYDLNTLDEASVHPSIAPYLEAWRSFRRDKDFNPLHIEQRLFSRIYQFAGTPDRVGSLNGELVVLELKCVTAIRPVTALQTAAQQILVEEWLAMSVARCAIQLCPNGAYRYCQFNEKADRRAFLAALQLYQWKARFTGA